MASKRKIPKRNDPDGTKTVTVRGMIIGHLRVIGESQGFRDAGHSDKSAGARIRYSVALVAQACRKARKPRRLVKPDTKGGG